MIKTITTKLSFSTKPLREIGHATEGSVKRLLLAAKVLREHGPAALREFLRVSLEAVEFERQMAELVDAAHAKWKEGENE